MNTPSADHTTPAVTIGIDLGGSGTRIVALDTAGQPAGRDTTPTLTDTDQTAAVRALADRISQVAAGRPIDAIGIGASGPLDAAGIIHNHATLPAFSDLELTRSLEAAFGVRCVIDNDAATAALGELTYGAHRDSRALLTVTLGTGIGAAFIDNGHLFKTVKGTHPELGHIAVPGPGAPCYCGLATCWEQLASRTALTRQLGRDPDTAATQAHSGDTTTALLFDRYGHHVGTGLSTLLCMFQPTHIVLGGGAARYFDLFDAGMRCALQRSDPFVPSAVISRSSLGADAGALGAAALARPHR